jgi:hypothetical protein
MSNDSGFVGEGTFVFECVGIWEIKRMGKYLKLGIGEVKKIVGIEEIIEPMEEMSKLLLQHLQCAL